MVTKKTTENSEEYGTLFISEKDERFNRFLLGAGAKLVRRLRLEADICCPLTEEKKTAILYQAYNAWAKKIDDSLILKESHNKKMTIGKIKKSITDLQTRIKELELNTEIDLETKTKKIAKCYAVIKNCQSTLDREVACRQYGC